MKPVAHLFGVPTKEELQERTVDQRLKAELDDWSELEKLARGQNDVAVAVLAGAAFIGAIAVFDAAKTTDHRIAVGAAFLSALLAATAQSILIDQQSFFARDGSSDLEDGARTPPAKEDDAVGVRDDARRRVRRSRTCGD